MQMPTAWLTWRGYALGGLTQGFAMHIVINLLLSLTRREFLRHTVYLPDVEVEPEDAETGDEYHPVPEEHVDRLIVEVDGQYTLNGVRVDVDHVLTAHFEVAQRHSWKRHITLLGPVLVRQQVAHNLEAERLVLGRQDEVEQEQLTDHVSDVEDFRDEEQHHQIVADSVTNIANFLSSSF